jgi:hypothetical protein
MVTCKAGMIALLAAGLFAADAAAQEARDMHLEDMGFVMRPALTPQQLERLKLLPPDKFVSRSKNGRRYFLYADPTLCKCVFVGDELAMSNYQNLVAPPPPLTTMGGPPALPPGARLYQEMDPGLSGLIPDGDILDNPN